MEKRSSTGDELRAAVEARRELGPEYEDSLIEGFLDKMGQEIDRRVEEQVAARVPQRQPKAPGVRPGVDAGQRLALAIVSIVLGVGSTVAFAVTGANGGPMILVWIGIVVVNIAFAAGSRR
ncbi:hypothetical protein AB0D67_04370 [Streptosporangium sp. NPDC048047]|uniref:hypothetical protein n=1 Tax=Streptosporangium sp. NPDC048047 TaxID=3155748 RepID=UPI00342CD06B